MGSGFYCKCPKCNYELTLYYGSGKMYPYTYLETLKDAKEGKYGKGIADYLSKNPDAAISAEASAFICTHCSHIQDETNLKVYHKKDGAAIPEELSAAPWWIVHPEEIEGYVNTIVIDRYYRLTKYYRHRCEKCNSVMKILSKDEFLRLIEQRELRCPVCQTAFSELKDLFWD